MATQELKRNEVTTFFRDRAAENVGMKNGRGSSPASVSNVFTQTHSVLLDGHSMERLVLLQERTLRQA